MSNTRYVSYLRVSTDRQGRSGLGIDAQRSAVADHLQSRPGRLLAEVVEVESGRRKDRPKLAEAIMLCRAHRATLLVAKLDRLARNAAFLLSLRDAGVDFVACDMPDANRMTVGILAVVAEAEADMISARTKSALAAAKLRRADAGLPGLGGFRGRAGTASEAAAARQARSAKADARAADLLPILMRIDPGGTLALSRLAAALNAEAVPTPGGRGNWSAATVSRLRARSRRMAAPSS